MIYQIGVCGVCGESQPSESLGEILLCQKCGVFCHDFCRGNSGRIDGMKACFANSTFL